MKGQTQQIILLSNKKLHSDFDEYKNV